MPLNFSKTSPFKSASRSRPESRQQTFSKFKSLATSRLAQPNAPQFRIGHLPKSMLPFGPGLLGKGPAQHASGLDVQTRTLQSGRVISKPTSRPANLPPRPSHRPDPAPAPISSCAPSNSALPTSLQHRTEHLIFPSFGAMFQFFTNLAPPTPDPLGPPLETQSP